MKKKKKKQNNNNKIYKIKKTTTTLCVQLVDMCVCIYVHSLCDVPRIMLFSLCLSKAHFRSSFFFFLSHSICVLCVFFVLLLLSFYCSFVHPVAFSLTLSLSLVIKNLLWKMMFNIVYTTIRYTIHTVLVLYTRSLFLYAHLFSLSLSLSVLLTLFTISLCWFFHPSVLSPFTHKPNEMRERKRERERAPWWKKKTNNSKSLLYSVL